MNGIKLIIGLGNPDPEYIATYHNVGHQFILFLIKNQEMCAPDNTSALCTIKLLKTDAYMNESGACVKTALKKYTLKPDQAMVVHDDSDIVIGAYKLSFARNAGGHRGVQNIIDYLKTNKFWRLRIGIRPASAFHAMAGKPVKKWIKAEKLVLKKISPADKKKLQGVFKKMMKVL